MSGSGAALSLALRVSTKTFSSCAWKSFSAASASVRVMSPRPTSASVYSFRTLRLWSMMSYINGWVNDGLSASLWPRRR